jgi:hypothetical protein
MQVVFDSNSAGVAALAPAAGMSRASLLPESNNTYSVGDTNLHLPDPDATAKQLLLQLGVYSGFSRCKYCNCHVEEATTKEVLSCKLCVPNMNIFMYPECSAARSWLRTLAALTPLICAQDFHTSVCAVHVSCQCACARMGVRACMRACVRECVLSMLAIVT